MASIAMSHVGKTEVVFVEQARRYIAYIDSQYTISGQLVDKPTRGQSSRGLVNSQTSHATRRTV